MTLIDRALYAYIKGIKRWMECPVCHGKMKFSKKSQSWECNSCEYALLETDFLDDFVFWFCDGCNTYLNVQKGFDRKGKTWVCKKCGFNNDITFNNIRGVCKDCGDLLYNPNATICDSCKAERLCKAKAFCDTASEICYTLADSLQIADDTDSQEFND